MTVYIIAEITIHDRDTYARYEAGFAEVFTRYNGTMLAVDDAPRCLEGEWSATRSVLISFPSAEEADAWYASQAYQDLAKHRLAASSGNIIVVDALPGT